MAKGKWNGSPIDRHEELPTKTGIYLLHREPVPSLPAKLALYFNVTKKFYILNSIDETPIDDFRYWVKFDREPTEEDWYKENLLSDLEQVAYDAWLKRARLIEEEYRKAVEEIVASGRELEVIKAIEERSKGHV